MKSICCNAKMRVDGNTTRYYTCGNCGASCDISICSSDILVVGDSVKFNKCTCSENLDRAYRLEEALKVAKEALKHYSFSPLWRTNQMTCHHAKDTLKAIKKLEETAS